MADPVLLPVPGGVESIRPQVERILSNRRFATSERQRRLLRYLLEQTLEGRAAELKEYVLGVDVFDRGADFDPQVDPIVRTELSRLRSKLKDYYESDGRDDALIIDLPKRSLALTFQLKEAPAASPAPEAVRSWLGGKWLNASRIAAATAVMIALSLVWAVARTNTTPSLEQRLNSNPTSVAVLPFVTVGGDADMEYFSDGLTEELIHRLAEIDGLRVASRTSTFQFKGRRTDLRSIATQLGAEVVVEGTVRRSGGRVRVIARLVNVSDGYELLSNVYDRGAEDILEVEEEIAGQIASTLRVHQLGRRGIPIKQFTNNVAAYKFYLEGRYHANKGSQLGLEKAIERYEQAIAADPNYAPAHARLADAYIVLSLLNEITPNKAIARAKTAAQQAVKAGDALSEAHSALGSALALYDWDWAGAEREFRRALELDPNDSAILEAYAMRCLLPQGRLDAALFQMRLAENLDPFSPHIVLGLGRMHDFKRDPDGAINFFQKVLRLEPKFEALPMALANAYIQKAALGQALNTLQATSAPTEDEARLAVLGHVYARNRQPDRARQVLRQLRDLSRERYVSGYYFALIQLALGEKEPALDSLEKAAADHCPLIVYLKINPLFDPLRPEPRFTALLKRTGLGG